MLVRKLSVAHFSRSQSLRAIILSPGSPAHDLGLGAQKSNRTKIEILPKFVGRTLCFYNYKLENLNKMSNGIIEVPVTDSPSKRQRMEVDDEPIKPVVETQQVKEISAQNQQPMEEVVVSAEIPVESKVASNTPVLKFMKDPAQPDAKPPVRKSEFAAGFDIYGNEECVVPARGQKRVKTGIMIALPDGCYGRIAPRSGLADKHSIDVGAGVIDQDYRGEVMVILFNFSDVDFHVKKHERIAQLICERIFTPTLEECKSLPESVRGAGGFGSTGKTD